jgi:hypothetical protein
VGLHQPVALDATHATFTPKIFRDAGGEGGGFMGLADRKFLPSVSLGDDPLAGCFQQFACAHGFV